VRFVIVNLQPITGQGAEADAMTDENGVFELRSFANDGSKDGAVPGRYRVELENYDVVRAVRHVIPAGMQPTVLPDDLEYPTIIEIQPGDNEVVIVIP
jgi:hypothetical protein